MLGAAFKPRSWIRAATSVKYGFCGSRDVTSRLAKLNRSNSVVALIQLGPPFQPLTSGGLSRSCPIRRSNWVTSGPMFWVPSALKLPAT